MASPELPSSLRQHYDRVLGDRLRSARSLLDVGCGSGAFAEYAEAKSVRVVGIDRRQKGLSQSRNRDRTLADGERLPFPSGGFDLVTSMDALEWTRDAIAFLSESARVCAPFGAVASIDTDWGTLAYASLDPAATKAILRAFADTGPNAWIGRSTPALMRRAGLRQIEWHPDVVHERSYDHSTWGHHLSRVIADWVVQKRACTEDEVAGWLADLRRHAQRGDYLFSAVRHVSIGTPAPRM